MFCNKFKSLYSFKMLPKAIMCCLAATSGTIPPNGECISVCEIKVLCIIFLPSLTRATPVSSQED